MANKNEQINDRAEREIAISRILNAPRELVWQVWTEPEHLAQWWGPDGFTSTIHEMNVSPGGAWRHIMHGPDGTDYLNDSVFTEVIKPERIVYEHANPKFTTTVTFEDQNGKTKLVMSMIFESAEVRDFVVKEHGAIEGQKQTIARLEEHLSGMLQGEEMVLSRVFNAPRERVYKALSNPGAIAQWWGPKGSKINISKFDFSPGGIFHYNMEMFGKLMWGKFRYLEMVEPERIVFVNSFSDEEGNITTNPFLPNFPLEVLNIVTFAEHEGKTTLTFRGGPLNATEAEQKVFRDMQASMQQGFGGTFDQLEEYLKTLPIAIGTKG